jgi:DNA polymerase-3 subunit delta
VPDDYERGAALKMILAYFKERSPVFLNGADAVFSSISDALLSPSLFGGEPLIVLDEAEKMGKKELQALADLVVQAPLHATLLSGARSKTPLSAAFEKVGVVFDMADEKPWDKEKRLAYRMVERVHSAGKRLASDAVPLLFERLGPDLALMESEIDKLICFVGEKPTIERSDVFRISASSRKSTLWQMAEEIVWDGAAAGLDSESFYGLVPALRSQLQLGLKLTELIAANSPREEWNVFLPRLWPKVLEKRQVDAQKLGAHFFQRGLETLFQIELLSRSGNPKEGALLDFFRISLHAKR